MEQNGDDTVVNVVIRLQGSLHQRLTAEAKRFERSLQREMIWRLRKSLERQETATQS
jgi:Mn-dependent DtxR family transcriptional regulator